VAQNVTTTQLATWQVGLIATTKSPQPSLALEAWVAQAAAESAPVALVKPPTPKLDQPAAAEPSRAPIKKEPPLPEIKRTTPAETTAMGPVPEQAYELLKAANHSLYALVRTCDFTLSGDQALISCRFNFHYDRLKEDKNRHLIEQALTEATGKDIAVIIEHNPTAGPSPVEQKTELVSSALEILGGEVIGE